MPQFFIDRPIFAWVVALFILLAGLLAIPQLPVAQYPNVAPPKVEIYAVYPGASAQTLDESVVSLIEQELNGADHLLYFESQSSLGSATITATFQPGTNPEMAQVDVQNRLKAVEPRLPQAVTQQGLQVEKVSAGFLLLVTLTSNDGKLDDVALSDYLARNVMNELKRLDGVGKAQLYGAERAMRVWIDPQKLIGFNLTPFESGLITFTGALGSIFMKAVVARVLRRFGYRPVLVYNSVISGGFLAACASFVPGMPYLAMVAILLTGGFFRSLQFTSVNTLAYAEIEPRLMSRATAIVSVAQQLALSTGVAVGALIVEVTLWVKHTQAMSAADFPPAFLVIGALTAASGLIFRRLPADAGAELSGRVSIRPEAADRLS